MKRRILVFTVIMTLIFMTACGSGGANTQQEASQQATSQKETIQQEETKQENDTVSTEETSAQFTFDYEIRNTERDKLDFGKVDKVLDVEAVYDKIQYIPEMFYGRYEVPGARDNLDDYKASVSYIEDSMDKTGQITSVPFRIYAGPFSNPNKLHNINNHKWAELFYLNGDGKEVSRFASYKVSGDTISFTFLESYEYDSETLKLSYKLSDITVEYKFAFKGPELTLLAGENSVTLRATRFDKENIKINIGHYTALNTPSLDGIDKLSFTLKKNEIYKTLMYEGSSNVYSDVIIGMNDEGLFVMTCLDPNKVEHTYQFVYFYCEADGIILTDGKNTYFYNNIYADRRCNNLISNLSVEDSEKLKNVSEEKLTQIVETKANLLEDLGKAFQTAGLQVNIKEDTGEIELDSTVLFGVNESSVSEEGKEFLKQFLSVYTSVVFDEKYADFLSWIMVEGHTDTSGTYEQNLQLSKDRAQSVKEFCLSGENGLDATYVDALASSVKALGYSWDNPIYDENGNVDMDASRRVTFRFIINLGE